MNKKQVKDSISHWKRMIKYVSKYENKKDQPDENVMELQLGETWTGEYCSLCKEYFCTYCPLTKAGKCCEDERSPWRRVSNSQTWKTWLINARKMLKVLESLMKK